MESFYRRKRQLKGKMCVLQSVGRRFKKFDREFNKTFKKYPGITTTRNRIIENNPGSYLLSTVIDQPSTSGLSNNEASSTFVNKTT